MDALDRRDGPTEGVWCEGSLVAAAAALAGDRSELTDRERRLIEDSARPPADGVVAALRRDIVAGGDPLGDAFGRVRAAAVRRASGATYTPLRLVDAMADWATAAHVQPAQVVDPGAGSGRFLAAAARRFPLSALVAVETDPLATLMLRANAAVLGFADRLRVLGEDYRDVCLPEASGTRVFIGNPPYVRHHDIPDHWKKWFAEAAAGFGVKASKLAGLHIHFFVRTLQLAKAGDLGCFITSAEWLDVNYGSALRTLLADGLGGTELSVFEPAAMPFSDAATTGAVTCFAVGGRPKSLRVRSVSSPEGFDLRTPGRSVPWSSLERAPRWSAVVRPVGKPPSGFLRIGDLFRVHRGQVTGDNRTWIADAASPVSSRWLFPTVTKARDLLDVGEALIDEKRLRRVIDLPADLGELDATERVAVERFLDRARERGVDRGYIARHRRAWWSVRLRAPAPILCTYMARRPPAFVRNVCGARHINIAHGLYPVEALADDVLAALVAWLRANVGTAGGRTYAGGLTKFEPREIERIAIPRPETLNENASCLVAPSA